MVTQVLLLFNIYSTLGNANTLKTNAGATEIETFLLSQQPTKDFPLYKDLKHYTPLKAEYSYYVS